MMQSDGANVHRLVQKNAEGSVEVMRVNDVEYVRIYSGGVTGDAFKFTFNGQQAELGGEEFRLYYYPKGSEVEAFVTLYCASKSERETMVHDSEYSFPSDWTEADLQGIAFYVTEKVVVDPLNPSAPPTFVKKKVLFRLSSDVFQIDLSKDIRIVFSDVRDSTTEVYAYYFDALKTICQTYGLYETVPFYSTGFWYIFTDNVDHPEAEREPNIDVVAGSDYMPMFEGYEPGYGVLLSDWVDNHSTVNSFSYSCVTGGGFDPFTGTRNTEDTQAFQRQSVLNSIKVKEIEVFDGKVDKLRTDYTGKTFRYEVNEDVSKRYLLISGNVTTGDTPDPSQSTVTVKMLEIDVTCPEFIYRLKTLKTYDVSEKTWFFYWPPTTTWPATHSEGWVVTPPGTTSIGHDTVIDDCHSTILDPASIGYDYGSIDNIWHESKLYKASESILPTISSGICSYAFTANTLYTKIVSKESKVKTLNPGDIEMRQTLQGGDVANEEDSTPLAITIKF
jgi:hypothetical protein